MKAKTLRNFGVYVTEFLCQHSPEFSKISHPYLTPRGWIILENLIAAQMLKKYAVSIMCGAGRFIAVVTDDRLVLWTWSTHPTIYFLKICLITFTLLCPDLVSSLHSDLSVQICLHILQLSWSVHIPFASSFWFHYLNNVWVLLQNYEIFNFAFFASLLLGRNIDLSTLSENVLNLNCSFILRD
jgi:hypothetical protein